MWILAFILGGVVYGMVDSLKKNAKNLSRKAVTVRVIILVVAAVLCLICLIGGLLSIISDSGGRSWSDLSDVEKDNARWAYEAQQAINDYRN